MLDDMLTNSDVWQSGRPLHSSGACTLPTAVCWVTLLFMRVPSAHFYFFPNHLTDIHRTCYELHTPVLCFNVVGRKY
jgi:hypothetical protein